MKTLYESLLGDIETSMAKGEAVMEDVIRGAIDEIYKYTKNTKFEFVNNPNSGKVIVNAIGDISVKPTARNITTLEHELFEWGTVDGEFSVWKCTKLVNLKGSPTYVIGSYNVNQCSNLKTLEGAPEKSGSFYCVNTSINSLKGSPTYVMGDFICDWSSNLKTLEYAPKYIASSFSCAHSANLKSLVGIEGITIGKDFDCSDCKNLVNVGGAPKIIYGKCFVTASVYDKAVEILDPACVKPKSFDPADDIRVIKFK